MQKCQACGWEVENPFSSEHEKSETHQTLIFKSNPGLFEFLSELNLELYDIECYFRDSKILTIILTNRDLEAIPSSIGKLTTLTYLDFSRNYLCELPEEIKMLTKLGEINLTDNNFSSIPSVLFEFEDLRAIRLNGNFIHRLDNGIFTRTNFPLLRILDLSNNYLTQIPLSLIEFKGLNLLLENNKLVDLPLELIQSKLSFFNINGNPQLNECAGFYVPPGLTKKDTSPLESLMENVIQLKKRQFVASNKDPILLLNEIEDNELRDIISSEFDRLETRQITCQICKIEIPDDSHLHSQTSAHKDKIEELNPGILAFFKEIGINYSDFLCSFNDGRVVGLDLNNQELSRLPASIQNLPSLTKLDLSNNYFQNLPQEVAELTELEDIYLSRNQFTAIPDCLYSLPKLRSLDLNNNYLHTDLNPIFLPTRFPKLSHITFSDNYLTIFPITPPIFRIAMVMLDNNRLTNLPLELLQANHLGLTLEGNHGLGKYAVRYSKYTGFSDVVIYTFDYLQEGVVNQEIKKCISQGKPFIHLLELVRPGVKDFIIDKISNLKELLVYRLTSDEFNPAISTRIAKISESNPILEELEVLIGRKIPHTRDPEVLCNTVSYLTYQNRIITGLNLSGCELTHFPVRITQFPSLKYLILRENQISDLPQEIADMRQLETLDLENNKLTQIQDQLSLLPFLKTLVMTGNDLTSSEITIPKLSVLQELFLENTKLHSIPQGIDKLDLLETLMLNGNKLIKFPEISNLRNMKYLNLADNQLSQIPRSIEACVKLAFLDISNNQLKDLPSELMELPNLQYLDISNNNLSEIAKPSGILYLKKE